MGIRRVLSAAVLFVSTAPSLAAQEPPTLQATYEWLAGHMADLRVEVVGTRWPIHHPQMWWKDCDVQLFRYMVGSDRASEEAYRTTRQSRRLELIAFNFRDLNLSSARKISANTVSVSTTGSRPAIVHRNTYEGDLGRDGSRYISPSNEDGLAATVKFEATNGELPDRLVRALRHAIRLCGGSATPDLFADEPGGVTRARTKTAETPLNIRIGPSKAGPVNVRRSPNFTSQIVAQVHPGETYVASAIQDGWYRIDAKGGWVAGRYVVVN